MPLIHRIAIVPYSTEQMYTLVNNIASYQTFVPYCVSSVVNEQSEDTIHATITLSAKGFQKSFTTLNRLSKNNMMEIQLLDGPFKHLEGYWKFEAHNEHQCAVTLDLNFELSSKLVAMMFGSVFQQVAEKLVDAFVERANVIYGHKKTQ